MLLDKWYLDTVFPDGTVWFGYRAWLRLWRGPHLCWAAGCEVLPGGRQQKASRWVELAEPRLENGQWQWRGPDGFEAQWQPCCPAVQSELGSQERFRVHWSCVAPRAAVTRTQRAPGGSCGRPGAASHGDGYIEHLRLEAAGCRMPLRDLWWGRAHAGPSSLVWIRWGLRPDLWLAFENGVPVNALSEARPNGDVCIQTQSGVWQTQGRQALCDRDVRRSFPRWLVWLTGGLAPSREHKVSGAVRLRSNEGTFEGSGIWEEVKWP